LNAATVNGVTITGTSSVTGATVQTAATGRRIVMTPSGTLELYSGLSAHSPGVLEAGTVQTNGVDGWARIKAPAPSGVTAELYMEAEAGGMKLWKLGPLTVVEDPPPTSVYASTRAIVDGTAEVRGNAWVYDTLTAGNIKTLHVTITPTAANTPTSMTITGLGMPGVPRVSATATTTLPGTRVTGVG
ncbi:hypothetical protein, partial [Streptomyces sp. SID7909]|uniref:hypothetical protein n=1 Tax=Streptomyces sp. SID7909 TaxID=2706092 RepID=UPI0013B7BDD2